MSDYHTIDEISALPRYLTSGPLGWGFQMWSNNLDDNAPHRSMLERFAAAYPDIGIKLPLYERYEDYVEATAVLGGATIEIYYETILGFILFWSLDRDAISAFRTVLLPLAK